MIPGFYNHNYLILQTPDYVALQVEMIHDTRIIPLKGRSDRQPRIRQWLGDSVGYWEGDTLVVETTNFAEKAEQRIGVGPTFLLIGAGQNEGGFRRSGPNRRISRSCWPAACRSTARAALSICDIA